MEPKNTKETKKRTKVPTSFDSQFFPGKARKEEPDVSTLADAAIGEDALEAFRLLCLKNWGILTATDPVDWHGCSLALIAFYFFS